MKLTHKITVIKNFLKLVLFIAWFNFFYIIKDIYISKIVSKNASLLEKLKNKIPPCTFWMKAIIPSVFDVIVKLSVYGHCMYGII